MLDSENESEINGSSNLVEQETQSIDKPSVNEEIETDHSTDEIETKSDKDASYPTVELSTTVNEEGTENGNSSKSNDGSDISSDSSSKESTNEEEEKEDRSQQNESFDLNKEVDKKSCSSENSKSCENFDEIEKEFDDKMNTYSLVKNNAQTDVRFCI